MLPLKPIEILQYVDARGRSPFERWFDGLDARAAAKVTAVIDRIGRGLMTNVKSVGAGVFERRIDFGPGYRVYFGTETDGRVSTAVILLHGGSKSGQRRDILLAKRYWKDYKTRRREGES